MRSKPASARSKRAAVVTVRLQTEPVVQLDDEAVVGRRGPERVEVAAEPEVARGGLAALGALPDEEERRAGPVLPAQDHVADQGADVEVLVREAEVGGAVPVEIDPPAPAGVLAHRARAAVDAAPDRHGRAHREIAEV